MLAKNMLSLIFLLLYTGTAFAQVNDGTGALADLQTWFQTIVPIIAGIILLVMFIAWGASWIQGSWVPKMVAGIFGAGVSSYIVGIFL